MRNILSEICEKKRSHVESQKRVTPLDGLKKAANQAPAPAGFYKKLNKTAQAGEPALIAEIKKASPSKGIIRADFDPVEIAALYQEAGASCLSVLTDEPYFQGADGYLKQVKASCDLPLLRKDFMLDPYQIYESRALGADCILLIMAALDDDVFTQLYDLAVDLGMDVLTEIHDAQELERAMTLRECMMIGVNNRNLKTLEVDIQTAFDLAPDIPASTLKVAESGLSDYETLKALQNAGYGAFLVGESLMREEDIAAATRKLLGHTT